MYYSTNSETTRKRDAALTATPDRSAKATLIDLDHSYSWMSHHRGALGADPPRPLPPHKTPPRPSKQKRCLAQPNTYGTKRRMMGRRGRRTSEDPAISDRSGQWRGDGGRAANRAALRKLK